MDYCSTLKLIIMRKISFFMLLMVLAIFSSCNSSDKSNVADNTVGVEPEVSATVEELGQMNRDFARLLTARDAAGVANLYDENGSILPPNESIVKGRANIQKYWQAVIDGNFINGSVKTIDAKNDGALAYEVGSFSMLFKGAKGDTIEYKGKYTEILQLDSASGKWLAIYGMWSSDDPAH
jgi:ketosteroid isomerase-like protein